MEFLKVIEIRNRMCNNRPCVDCPLFAIKKEKERHDELHGCAKELPCRV